MSVLQLNRTLDQELMALARGASLECLACGEFVLHEDGRIACPECGSSFPALASGEPALDLPAARPGA